MLIPGSRRVRRLRTTSRRRDIQPSERRPRSPEPPPTRALRLFRILQLLHPYSPLTRPVPPEPMTLQTHGPGETRQRWHPGTMSGHLEHELIRRVGMNDKRVERRLPGCEGRVLRNSEARFTVVLIRQHESLVLVTGE
jgi:hypothetical protein